MPCLAAGVELIGEYQGSGLAEATYLARNAVGQVAHLSRLLYLVVERDRRSADQPARSPTRSPTASAVR